MGSVFPVMVVAMMPPAEFGRNDHREDPLISYAKNVLNFDQPAACWKYYMTPYLRFRPLENSKSRKKIN